MSARHRSRWGVDERSTGARRAWLGPVVSAVAVIALVPWSRDPAAAQAPPGEADQPAEETLAEAPQPVDLVSRAVVFLEAAEDVDEFTPVFLYELLAARLRAQGFAVERGDSSEAGLPGEGSQLDCLARAGCPEALQRAVEAPLVVALSIEPQDGGVAVTWRRSDQGEASTASGPEGDVGAQVSESLATARLDTLPCLVVRAGAVVSARFALDGAEVSLPALVTPGEHALEVAAEGRGGFNSPLQCAGGRVIRARVD